MRYADLSERDLKILEYITNNPGNSKEDVVHAMKENSSRMTVLNGLRRLEEYTMIVARKDKPNSQIYKLFVNKENLHATLAADLACFEKAYFSLLEKVKAKLNKKQKHTEFLLLSYIFSIYEDAVRMYIIRAMFMWPEKTSGSELGRLYSTLFSKLGEMQSKLSEAFLSTSFVLPVLENIILHSLEFPKHIEPALDYCKEYNLAKEAEAAIDAVWKITYDLFHLVYDNHPEKYNLNKVKGWRELLQLHKQHPELRDSVSTMRDSFLLHIDRRDKETKKNND